jgi:hypothetical protein
MVPNLGWQRLRQFGRSSSDLTKEEMGDLMTLIEMFGANHGVVFQDNDAMMARKRFSKTAYDKRLKAFGGCCRMCKQPITATSGLEWDHAIPIALGGEDAIANLEPLCVKCHRIKTKTDVEQIAKATRQRQANLGVKADKPKIPSKPKEPKVGKLLPPRRSLFIEVQP